MAHVVTSTMIGSIVARVGTPVVMARFALAVRVRSPVGRARSIVVGSAVTRPPTQPIVVDARIHVTPVSSVATACARFHVVGD